MAAFHTRAVFSEDNRKELYVYFKGHVIYKAWYLAGQKLRGRMFYEGEGLALETKRSIKEGESTT